MIEIENAYDRLEDSGNKMFVVIAGNIGCGKTTLTSKLSERLGWAPLFESVEENPFLNDFYKDMNRWAYHLQVYFLTHRFNTHKFIETSNSSSIQDRSIYEDAHIFARNLHENKTMSQREYDTYKNLYSTMTKYLQPPDLMIYLKRSVPKLMERIALRNRDCEKDMDVNYIADLNRYYDEWFEGYDLGKCLVIDTDELDFLYNEEHFDKLVMKIHDSIDQQDMFFSFQ